MPISVIYKIVPRPLWDAARQQGAFAGAPVDLADGFIHFSSAAQVEETARRHFAGEVDLLLLAVDPARLGDLRWEPSRGGDLFPHLYGEMPIEAVVREDALPWDGAAHVFPADLAPA